MPRSLGGARVTLLPASDIRTLAWSLEYSSGDLFRLAERYLASGDVVWDLGANVGIFSIAAAFRAGPRGMVFAVEADSEHAALLHQNTLRLGEAYSPVTAICAAVTNQMTCVNLNVVERGHAKNFLETVSGNPHSGGVIAQKATIGVTCDWLLKFWKSPNLVKVDVEGAELLFLEGARSLLERARPIIYLEVQEQNQTAVTTFLQEMGYTLFELDPTGAEKEIQRCAFNTLCRPGPPPSDRAP